jgi:O-acetyl-ADP-ribose deacetylase (regulator of RNase III)
VTQPGSPGLEAVWGDITVLKVDAVVNAANAALAGGGGVDGAIHRAAGAERLRAACAEIGGCLPGQAVATDGFDLPARWIIHTVGPVWQGGDRGEDTILASCYRGSLDLAASLGARSVAFPAIATGVYGFPAERAAAVAVGTVRSMITTVRRVLLVAFDGPTWTEYRRLLAT